MASIATEVAKVFNHVCDTGSYKGVRYLTEGLVVKLTRRHKVDRRDKRVEFVLTFGAPNYAERKFIKVCKKAGVKLPLSKTQLK